MRRQRQEFDELGNLYVTDVPPDGLDIQPRPIEVKADGTVSTLERRTQMSVAPTTFEQAIGTVLEDLAGELSFTSTDEVEHLTSVQFNHSILRLELYDKPQGRNVDNVWIALARNSIAGFAARTGMGSDAIIEEMRDTMIRKQRDYGPGNIDAFGELGVLVRATDKMARLQNLLINNPGEPSNESLADTWLDLANYCLIALMIRRGIWGLPMEDGRL